MADTASRLLPSKNRKDNDPYMDTQIRLHNMVLHTKVLGPNTRAAIWLQGCERRCEGCMSPASRPLEGGKLVPVSAIIEELSKLNDIEGVTISGGEPFLQPVPLLLLLRRIKDELGLGVIIYTGYTLSELQSLQNTSINEILTGYVDILIDGEYVDELNDGMALKGSSNQNVHFLTARYLSYAQIYKTTSRSAEVIASNQDLFFVGIPPKKTLEEWKDTVNHMKGPPARD